MTLKLIGQFVYKHFSGILIVGTFLVLFLGGCFDRFKPMKPSITVVRDTVYYYHDSTVYSKPSVIKTTNPVVIEPKYIPDTSYNGLKQQFLELRDLLLAQNIQRDILPIDTIGTIEVTDTVSKNQIQGRSYKSHFKIPVVTTTITKTIPAPKPRNQIYVGVETGGALTNLLDRAELGLLLKNKRDNIIGFSFGVNFQGSTTGSLKYYHKISLRKQRNSP